MGPEGKPKVQQKRKAWHECHTFPELNPSYKKINRVGGSPPYSAAIYGRADHIIASW
jgi:hypothetical protein